MNFLDPNYKQPTQKGNYLKIENGTKQIRIVSTAITGWIDRDRSGEKPKPIRTQEKQKPLHIDDEGKPIQPKHFRAVAVYDYSDNAVKVWEITQKQIQNAIMELYETPEYGDPKGYDLKVSKEGEKLTTKYSVIGLPPKKLDKAIQSKVEETPFNLTALFDGLDPFEVEPEDEMFNEDIA